MVPAVVTVRAEALVRAEPVKASRAPARQSKSGSNGLCQLICGQRFCINDLAFKNALSSANIVETFYLPTEWT
jgi:hypothetical protein